MGLVTLRKMNQDGRIYYYLEHPVKVNGKVHKYSRYIGREIPTHLEEVERNFLMEIENDKWERVSERARHYSVIPGSRDGASFLDKTLYFSSSFTSNSLRISGSNVTTLEMRRMVLEGKPPKLRSRAEVSEANTHYDIVLSMILDDSYLHVDKLVDWHWHLYRETRPEVAGVLAGSKPGESTVRNHDEIREDLENLFSWYRKSWETMNSVMLAGMVHVGIYAISPFKIGNEVIARLTMNCILYHNRYPMLDIAFNERKRYHDALERATTRKDSREFLKWLFLNYGRKFP